MAKRGRPPGSSLTQEEKNYIVEQMATGRAVSDICEDEQVSVSYRTVNRELHRDWNFATAYARAREAAVEPIVEEIEDVLKGKGEWANVEWEVRREIANNRRWLAIRLQKARYGDKINLDVQAQVKVTDGRVIDAEALPVEQLFAVRDALRLAANGPVEDVEEIESNE